MNWALVMELAERDIPRLYRNRQAVLDGMDALGQITDPVAKKQAALRLSLDHPGIGFIGDLIKMNDGDRMVVLIGISEPVEQRHFVEQLIQRIDNDESLYAVFSQIMPYSFPAHAQGTKPPRNNPQPKSPPYIEPEDPPPSDSSQIKTSAIHPLLSRLIAGIHKQEIVPSISLVNTVSGHFRGAPEQPNLRLQLKLLPDGDLQCTAVNQDPPAREAHEDRLYLPVRDQADFTLNDQSHINAEIATINFESHSVSAEFGISQEWRGLLTNWYWWKHEEVRYWVAFSNKHLSTPLLNLQLTDMFRSRIGIHIPDPHSLSMVNIHNKDSSLAILIEADPQIIDVRSLLTQQAILLQSVFGISVPTVFYGYDDRLSICAAIQIGHGSAKIFDIGHPFDFCSFIPSLRADASQFRGKAWMVPFVRRIRNEFRKRFSSILDSLSAFRWVTEESILDFQIEKLAKAIRILLLSEGSLRNQDYLDPTKVARSLKSLAHRLSIQLPKETDEALSLAHRMALIGPRGVSPVRMEAFLDMNRSFDVLSTLRTAYASLIAGIIGYTGPIFKGLAPDRSSSLVHQPLLHPDPKAVAEDEAMASERFVAQIDE